MPRYKYTAKDLDGKTIRGEAEAPGEDELYEQLDAVNDQISALRSRVICKKCGAENPAEACYCNMCGSKLDV